MKDLLKKQGKIIGATTLAAVITISMSFTTPEKIEVKAQETASVESTNFLSSARETVAITKITKITKKVVKVTVPVTVTITTELIGGESKNSVAEQSENYLKTVEQNKLKSLDKM